MMEALAMSDAAWQPIETAPRNGTPIVGMWMPIAVDGKTFGPDYCITLFIDGEWREVGEYNYLLGEPTRWMPLPPLPNM